MRTWSHEKKYKCWNCGIRPIAKQISFPICDECFFWQVRKLAGQGIRVVIIPLEWEDPDEA